jgi:hypothetical protein
MNLRVLSIPPLKFDVFAGVELTSPSAVRSFTASKVSCAAFTGTSEDAIKFTTTGGTSLRYDATSGFSIQNWQTPRTAGACYVVTMTAQDGGTLKAYFKIK